MWVGEFNFKRSGLECPCVARELLWSVAYSSSAGELVAVRVPLVLILFHQRTPSCFTYSQFEIVLLLSRRDRIQYVPFDDWDICSLSHAVRAENKFRLLLALIATLLS